MSLSQALQADAARTAFRDSLQLAKAAHGHTLHMQWRAAAKLYTQAADALLPDPNRCAHPDAALYRVRAGVCRAMSHCATPFRALSDLNDCHQRTREVSQ